MNKSSAIVIRIIDFDSIKDIMTYHFPLLNGKPNGCAKVYPHIDASHDNFIGFATTPDELKTLLDR